MLELLAFFWDNVKRRWREHRDPRQTYFPQLLPKPRPKP